MSPAMFWQLMFQSAAGFLSLYVTAPWVGLEHPKPLGFAIMAVLVALMWLVAIAGSRRRDV